MQFFMGNLALDGDGRFFAPDSSHPARGRITAPVRSPAVIEVAMHEAIEDAAAESPAFGLNIGRAMVTCAITPFTIAAIPIIDAIITVPALLIDFLVIVTVRLAE